MFTPLERKSQVELLREHFASVGSITGIEASALYRIRALPRRIKDLRGKGVAITAEPRTDATGQRYVRYFATLRGGKASR